ncbi:hypothetical protein D5R40_08180 [Okeania hirsuta]|uniref:Uncharacterized protein n=1 Tax=Okeania hirsuta TaxID=1458930 RepID=A0A3N6RU61_9CYAN|nr:hypothetical protein D4Z78_00820 [Okeania hirsuta]RQH48215.1 hypothetical protein D5R40_08180 [Okeania hirsuta]
MSIVYWQKEGSHGRDFEYILDGMKKKRIRLFFYPLVILNLFALVLTNKYEEANQFYCLLLASRK